MLELDTPHGPARAHLHPAGDALAGLPVVTGGRSSGARVACRTAEAVGAVGVLCLAFPLVAPAGKSRVGGDDRIEAAEPACASAGRGQCGMPAPGWVKSRDVV